jgi:ABC-type multidrug transport system ATPase subunit
MSVIVEVKQLRKSFGEVTAVDGLSFVVRQGDVYGFLGQNGAGKSTTIRMLLTLVRPGSGSIEIFGKELQCHRNDILRNIGAIIERPDLYKYLSAYDNLELFAKLSGINPTRNQLMDQLDKVGLADRATSKTQTYSQGMKQRLGIAIALIHDPELIILDEPTNGLDPQGIADMRNLIIDLRKTHKKTVIVSSHLLNEIEQVATRMIIIDKGKKVVEGTTEELFNPANTLVELETPDADAHEKILQSKWKESLQPTHGIIVFKLHVNDVPRLAKDIIDMDIRIYSLHKKHSLESLFLNLTGHSSSVAAISH